MGVYIKGFDFPILCERCPMLDWDLDYIKCKVTGRHFKMTECWRSIRVPDCPLVPVPPHGDLIDRDALLSQYKGNIWTAQTDYAEGLRDVAKDIADAPTIIPEEEGE